MTTTLADKPWLKSYDAGVPEDAAAFPEQTLHAFLERAAESHPNHTALVMQGKEITYRELNKLTDQIAAALHADGFRKGDRAVVYMPNSPQFVIAYYGILKAGGIVIATNPLYTERELKHQLHDCGAETVFVLTPYYELLKRVQASGETNVKRVIVTNIKEYFPFIIKLLFTLFREKKDGHRVQIQSGDVWFQDFLKRGAGVPKPAIDVSADDMALIQYTGGTTGFAKGAVALHRNMATNVYQLEAWVPELQTGKEVFLTAIPLFHSYGMVTGMHLGISKAGKIVLIPDPRNLDDVLGSIDKQGVTIFPGVPAMYIAINNNDDVKAGKYNVGSIRYCVSGSAPLLLDTKQTFEKLTGGTLVEGYGMTETHVVTHANPFGGRNVEGSIGLPIPGVECRVVDVADPTIELGIGEVGELVLKSPSVMQGYWNMPEATKSQLVDGWLYTGDVVECDDDGYFYIRDRKKDLIIAGGYNIYPREVEEVLKSHPDVVEVAVAGVTDPRRGETVKAWVVKTPNSAMTERDLIDWSKTQLAAYKYPRLIEFRDELPKTTVGKVLKRQLTSEHGG